jgi:hypothetical protein
VEIIKPQSTVVNGQSCSSTLQFGVGTVASKGIDRSGTFLSNSVAKKKGSQLPVGRRSAPY